MEGTYILTREDNGHYTVLRENKEKKLYEVVIPDAGYRVDFAYGLLALLNAQGSEVGNVDSSSN